MLKQNHIVLEVREPSTTYCHISKLVENFACKCKKSAVFRVISCILYKNRRLSFTFCSQPSSIHSVPESIYGEPTQVMILLYSRKKRI